MTAPNPYQPAGYGAPSPQYGPPAPTNTMAILAIIFAFVFSPLGIVFGFIARNQIRSTGEAGDGLALAGIIVGALFLILSIVYVATVLSALGTLAS
jgi:hypothetical protein